MGDKIGIKWAHIRERAAELIRAQVGADVSGPEKMGAVIDELARWLDNELRFGPGPAGAIAEAFDGPVLRAVLGLFAQALYEELRQDGVVP